MARLKNDYATTLLQMVQRELIEEEDLCRILDLKPKTLRKMARDESARHGSRSPRAELNTGGPT